MPVAGVNSVTSENSFVIVRNKSGVVVSPGISLVMPMFNESASVEKTMTTALESVSRNFSDFEIIVVDDGSDDGCANDVARWAKRDSRVTLLRRDKNERFGGALRAGLEAASKDLIFYTDFDLPVDPDFFPEVVNALTHSDVITGYSPEYPKNLSWSSRLLSRGYNLLTSMFFGLGLRDVNFGFKAMRRCVIDSMRLVSRSPFIDAELFIQARRARYRISEIAVPFATRQFGVSRIRRVDVVAWTLLDMARVWLNPPPLRTIPREAGPTAESEAPASRA
jgi:glycosyltransferase involved in cell wall biosynthesis